MSGLIAVTGASGFVGGHLLSQFREKGCALRILVRDPARLGFAAVAGAPLEMVRGDLEDAAALADLCRGADTLVHCAGLIAASSDDEFFAVNRDGTCRLVEAAREAGIRRVVLLSSLAAREPGLSAYGASKRAGEEELKARAGSMQWVILRPPAVYGPGDRATLPLVQQLSRDLAIIPGNPAARVSLIHVADLAAAIVHVARDESVAAEICELHDGTDGGYGWRDLRLAASGRDAGDKQLRCLFLPRPLMGAAAGIVQLAAPMLGRPPILTSGKVAELYHADWVCRHNLLETLTVWRPRIRFAQGFAETLAWYRREGWLS